VAPLGEPRLMCNCKDQAVAKASHRNMEKIKGKVQRRGPKAISIVADDLSAMSWGSECSPFRAISHFG